MPTCIFIYGTLKRGQSRDGLLAGQKLIGPASTQPLYRMFNVGSYPALVHADADRGVSIEGELWQVDDDCLASLDDVEAVDQSLYRREPIQLLTAAEIAAEAYFYLLPVDGLEDCGCCW